MSVAMLSSGGRRRAGAPAVVPAACRDSVLVPDGASAAVAFACRDIGLAPSCRQAGLVGVGLVGGGGGAALAPAVVPAACRDSVLVLDGASAAAAFACRNIGLARSCPQVGLVGAGLVGAGSGDRRGALARCGIAGGWA